MKLANVCNEDLKKISMMKNKKGCATSEAKRAQQILYSRNVTLGFSNDFHYYPGCTLDYNIDRQYKSFEEENGYPLEEVL